MDTESLSQTEFLLSLDTPQLVAINPQESYLKGWFVPPALGETWRLMVLVDGKEEPVYTGFPRPDVERHLSAPGAGKSGFVARLRTPEPGQRISLAAQIGGSVRELVGDLGRQERPSRLEVGSGHEKVSSYQEWLFEREPQLFQADSTRPALISDRPLISVLVEFQERHIYFLSMLLRSLSAQVYRDWQLCIAGDWDSHSPLFQYLKAFAATDSRLTIVPSGSKADHARAWNAALEAAAGEFIIPARLYDELHPFALWETVASLQGRELDIIYSDEDGIDLFGQRCRPQFKPDFDGERLLSINYVGYLTAIRRNLARQCGGFRSLPLGPREWDLLLRCVEQTQADRVAHIAKPLYHVRTQEALREAGVAPSFIEPDDLWRVVRDHVTRTGKDAVAQAGLAANTVRLQYRSPKSVSTSIFLRDDDGVFQVAALAELVNKHRVEFYGILNGIVHRLPEPRDGSNPALRPPLVTLAETVGDVLVFINRPIDLLNHFFLQELIAQALRPDCGLVSGLSVDLAGRFIHTGCIRADQKQCVDPFAGTDSRNKALGRHVRVVRSVEAISDEFFAVRREYVEAIGGFTQLASSMPQFVCFLVEHAHRHRLQVLVTPYSIGSFDRLDEQPPPAQAAHLLDSAIAYWNVNLSAFSDPYKILQS